MLSAVLMSSFFLVVCAVVVFALREAIEHYLESGVKFQVIAADYYVAGSEEARPAQARQGPRTPTASEAKRHLDFTSANHADALPCNA